jgi:hypothetical protein
VLAIDATSRAPLLVTRSYGTGKVLFMGTDSAWRWRKGVEDKYHYRFWGQVARWMAYQRQMAEGDSLRMFYTPDRPTTGNVVTLHATVLSADGAPLSDTKVEAEVTTPEGEQLRLQFQAEGKDWGLYTARFSPERPGSYAIALHCRETAAVLRTQLQVVGAEREVIGRPMRLDVLAELSQVTRGELLTPERLGEIADLVLELPAVEPIVRRQQIWASPWWAATLMTLLAIFWSGRKMIGAI